MLISMDTLTGQDMKAWKNLARYDAHPAWAKPLDRMEEEAVQCIQKFAEDGPCVVSTSWGKDSVVVAHLSWLAGLLIPLVWVPTVRSDGVSYEAEATYRVRDTYMADHLGQTYVERPAVARNAKRGDPGYDPGQYDRHGYRSQDVLKEKISERYVSGLRAQESRMRAFSIASRGLITPGTCRPLARWTSVHVFAYLESRMLPVHPAYAATFGGVLDRGWLRVHALRGKPPAKSVVYGRDMQGWEDAYFPSLTGHHPWPV